ncbi:hypothetical protein CVT24_007377 [Panaeolus cyanescens]|uniref:DUF6534 domain-containing protein n=1 Tax=Panaeolus cyanescens TaxID=181874 RepID=A0A409YKX0_9AGAR|nr:hypothetical protein CVT24_007377 [Panaeolus cyanescens]
MEVAAAATTVSGPPDVRLIFGPILLGVCINMILYGFRYEARRIYQGSTPNASPLQCYHYYLTYKKDAPWIRYLVLYLFIAETINTGCDIAVVFQPLINEFGEQHPLFSELANLRRWFQKGRPEATKYFPRMFASEPALIVFISTPIQLFFAWRIRLLTKSNIIAGIICIFSIVSTVGGVWTTVRLVQVRLFSRKPELHWPALVWFLAACISDVLITLVLVFTLSKRKTGFVATDDAISKIIRMTVQTGMLTAFFAIGDVVFFMTLPVMPISRTALNFIWDFALSKLYSNCLLSTLNARAELQELTGRHSQKHVSTTGGDFAMDHPPVSPRFHLDETRTIESYPSDQHIIGNAIYELDNRKSTSYEKSDIEYGITITKVVETRQDPTPTHAHTSFVVAQ